MIFHCLVKSLCAIGDIMVCDYVKVFRFLPLQP